MIAVLQRVARASVQVDNTNVASIGRGLLVLVGVGEGDTSQDVEYLARKILGMRLFAGASGRFDVDVMAAGGSLLVVSQFTLYGDVRRGRRPDFTRAARPEIAEQLIDRLVDRLRESGANVATGRFGAMMNVELVNDGPVTIIVESHESKVKSPKSRVPGPRTFDS